MKNYSKQREAILEKIKSTSLHPTADWLYRELKEECPKLSLATVYRNLKLLKEEGLIISVGVIEGQERFDSFIESHAHFICVKCKQVSDIPLVNATEAIINVLQIPVTVHQMDLIIHGICQACQ
jgi:Fur family peroxide stress response transcriptional regulator